LAARHGPVDAKGSALVPGHILGTPVEIEFERAVTAAHENGIPFVWVDDPDGLFPISARPSFQLTL
jgi:hypothetical protein